jgi:hypothetical protein
VLKCNIILGYEPKYFKVILKVFKKILPLLLLLTLIPLLLHLAVVFGGAIGGDEGVVFGGAVEIIWCLLVVLFWSFPLVYTVVILVGRF